MQFLYEHLKLCLSEVDPVLQIENRITCSCSRTEVLKPRHSDEAPWSSVNAIHAQLQVLASVGWGQVLGICIF